MQYLLIFSLNIVNPFFRHRMCINYYYYFYSLTQKQVKLTMSNILTALSILGISETIFELWGLYVRMRGFLNVYNSKLMLLALKRCII